MSLANARTTASKQDAVDKGSFKEIGKSFTAPEVDNNPLEHNQVLEDTWRHHTDIKPLI